MISHRHKAVFVHIPKCGGMSVEHLFLADLGLTWEQRAPLLLRERVEGEMAPPRLAHLTAREYIAGHYLTEEMWADYLTFAVVRDPHARAVSSYRYLALDRVLPFDRYVTEYLPSVLSTPAHPWRWFLRPQSEFVTDAAGALLVDHLVRLESIADDLPAVVAKAGLDIDAVPHVNATEKPRARRMLRARAEYARGHRRMPSLRHHTAAWTPELREAVAELYADDLALLA